MKRLLLLCLVSTSAFATFTNESELSLVNTSGNSNVENYIGKSKSKIELEANSFQFGGHYTYGTADKALSARDWDVFLGADHKLNERTALTFNEQVEGNKFAGIKIRYNTDLGAKVSLFKTEQNIINSELAYRYTVEKNILDETEHFNKALLALAHTYEHSKALKVESRAEYLANFTTSEDWEMKFTTSLYNAINSSFSLKLSYEWAKDNLPVIGATPYDRKFTTGLIAKF